MENERDFRLSDRTWVYCLTDRLNLGFAVQFEFDDHVRRVAYIGYNDSRDFVKRTVNLTLREFRKFKELWPKAFKTVKRVCKNYEDGEDPGDVERIQYPLSNRLMFVMWVRNDSQGRPIYMINVSPFRRFKGVLSPDVDYADGFTLDLDESIRFAEILPRLEERIVKDLHGTRVYTLDRSPFFLRELGRVIEQFHADEDTVCLRLVLLKNRTKHLSQYGHAMQAKRRGKRRHPWTCDEPSSKSEMELVKKWIRANFPPENESEDVRPSAAIAASSSSSSVPSEAGEESSSEADRDPPPTSSSSTSTTSLVVNNPGDDGGLELDTDNEEMDCGGRMVFGGI